MNTSDLLPESWAECDLNDLLEYVTSGSRDWSKYYAEVGANFIRTQDINQNKLNLDSVAKVSLPEKVEGKRTLVKKDDLLITITGANVGKCARVNTNIPESYVSQSVALVRLVDPSLSEFLQRQIIAPIGDQTALQKAAYGMGRPVLNLKNIRDFKVKLPAPSEQKFITEKLDALLAQVENTKARLERIPQILKRFRQSVLGAAVSGKLTEDWRGSSNTDGWRTEALSSLLIASANGLSKRSGKSGIETVILRLADFKDARRVYGNERKIKLDDKELKKYALADGDILVIRVNGSIDLAGRFIEYHSKDQTEGFCDHFIRLRIDTGKLHPTYLTYVANEGTGRQYLQGSLSTSAGQNTINQGSIKGLQVHLPPKNEQIEIIYRVDQLLTYADTIEEQVNNALDRVERLTQSILAKAFRGELTEQWRKDHPDMISGENSAEALLAKIKAAREAVKKQPKPNRTAVKKKTGSSMSKQIISAIEALKKSGKPLSGQQLLAAAGYPNDSNTEELETFFLDVREALNIEKSIVKLERCDDGQDWFALADATTSV